HRNARGCCLFVRFLAQLPQPLRQRLSQALRLFLVAPFLFGPSFGLLAGAAFLLGAALVPLRRPLRLLLGTAFLLHLPPGLIRLALRFVGLALGHFPGATFLFLPALRLLAGPALLPGETLGLLLLPSLGLDLSL